MPVELKRSWGAVIPRPSLGCVVALEDKYHTSKLKHKGIYLRLLKKSLMNFAQT